MGFASRLALGKAFHITPGLSKGFNSKINSKSKLNKRKRHKDIIHLYAIRRYGCTHCIRNFHCVIIRRQNKV